MKKSKVVFLLFAGIFLLILLYLAYDISSRTTWPGPKSQHKERLLKKKKVMVDTTVVVDSTNLKF